MFLFFVKANGAFFDVEFEDVGAGIGTGFPLRTMVATGLEASAIQAVNAGIGVVFGCADAVGATVKSAATVGVIRF